MNLPRPLIPVALSGLLVANASGGEVAQPITDAQAIDTIGMFTEAALRKGARLVFEAPKVLEACGVSQKEVMGALGAKWPLGLVPNQIQPRSRLVDTTLVANSDSSAFDTESTSKWQLIEGESTTRLDLPGLSFESPKSIYSDPNGPRLRPENQGEGVWLPQNLCLPDLVVKSNTDGTKEGFHSTTDLFQVTCGEPSVRIYNPCNSTAKGQVATVVDLSYYKEKMDKSLDEDDQASPFAQLFKVERGGISAIGMGIVYDRKIGDVYLHWSKGPHGGKVPTDPNEFYRLRP